MKVKIIDNGRLLLETNSIYNAHKVIESILLLISTYEEFNYKNKTELNTLHINEFHSFQYLWLSPQLMQVILPYGYIKLYLKQFREGILVTFSSSSISSIGNSFVEKFMDEICSFSEE